VAVLPFRCFRRVCYLRRLVVGGAFNSVNSTLLGNVVQKLANGQCGGFDAPSSYAGSGVWAVTVYQGILYAGYGCGYVNGSTAPQGLSS
jgi:hypothetical protein